MRITLDTDAKVVTLLHEISMKELEQVKKIIGESWKDWKIQPIYTYYPSYPINTPWITYDTPTTNAEPLVTFTAITN